jgi:hypothetical protein
VQKPSKITTYFRELCEQLLAIGHTPQKPRFFRSKEEAQAHISQISDVIFYIDQRSSRFPSDADNAKNIWTIPVVILCQHKIDDNFSSQEAAIDKAFEITHDILSRMAEDRITPGWNATGRVTVLPYFDLASVAMLEEKNVFDGFSGIRTTFSIGFPNKLKVNEDKWNTPTPDEQ